MRGARRSECVHVGRGGIDWGARTCCAMSTSALRPCASPWGWCTRAWPMGVPPFVFHGGQRRGVCQRTVRFMDSVGCRA
eukprot:10556164-Lingulodinium_polyedra.AAC.1